MLERTLDFLRRHAAHALSMSVRFGLPLVVLLEDMWVSLGGLACPLVLLAAARIGRPDMNAKVHALIDKPQVDRCYSCGTA